MKIEDTDNISDGYHTFGELYDHRRALTVALFRAINEMCGPDAPEVWHSKQHHPDDSPIFEGYFIVGANLPNGQVSYHYKLHHWDKFDNVEELEHAPKWDGHTPELTITRLEEWGLS